MRKTICLVILAIFVLAGCSSMQTGKEGMSKSSATVEVASPVKWGKKATATIMGKGFNPGQEVNILFTPKDGVPSDIGWGLKANDSGDWSTKFDIGRFIDRKLVDAGKPYKLVVTDSNYVPIAQTYITITK